MLAFPCSYAEEAELLALRACCMQYTRPLLQNYIWQKESFELTPSTNKAQPWAKTYGQQPKRRGATSKVPKDMDPSVNGSSQQQQQQPTCLWGSLCWGENVEDEWFVVYLLLEMTKHIQGLSARVS
jgi:hypothetical protein